MVPASFSGRHALFFSSHDVEGHDGEHGAVHGHRNRHAIERNAVEQDLHIEDRVDGHAGFAYIARHALVVGIVAAMGSQIESDRQTLLARGEVAAIKGVRLFRRGESGVLADGPRAQAIHGAVRTAQKRRHTRRVVEMLETDKILSSVEILHCNVLEGKPVFCRHRRSGFDCLGLEVDLGKIRSHNYLPIPKSCCSRVRTSMGWLRR